VLVQFTICPLMCATVPGVHIRFYTSSFVLKIGCDNGPMLDIL